MGTMSEIDVKRHSFRIGKQTQKEARNNLFTAMIEALLIIDCDEDAEAVAEIFAFEEEDEPQGFGRFSAADLERGDWEHDHKKDG